MRKSLWSPDEDAKLKKYVKQFGYGNWSDVAKHAGLQRCGKSCRLRWLNYLRPDLKRGKFSPDEIRLIVKLHKSLGNSWSKIAACLPGRTDNDIKNFWHSYTRSTQRVILSPSSSAAHANPPADCTNTDVAVTQPHVPDHYKHASHPTLAAWHNQQLTRADIDLVIQGDHSYDRPYCSHWASPVASPVTTNCAVQPIPMNRGDDKQPQFGVAQQTNCSSIQPPSAVSLQDSSDIGNPCARDAFLHPSLSPAHHHNLFSRVSPRCFPDQPFVEPISINPVVRPCQDALFHYQHDGLPPSAFGHISESTDDCLQSVLLNFIGHRLLHVYDDFTQRP